MAAQMIYHVDVLLPSSSVLTTKQSAYWGLLCVYGITVCAHTFKDTQFWLYCGVVLYNAKYKIAIMEFNC